MKNKIIFVRVTGFATLAALIFSNVSCMTTYDANGRPMQTVDPVVAVAGVAAAGLIGYAVANNHSGHRGYHRNHYYGDYYDPCY